MGHQFSYFAAPDDLGQIHRRIRGVQPSSLIDWRSPTAIPRVLESIDVVEGGHRLLHLLMVREVDISKVVTRHVPAQGYWTVDVLLSPVVEFGQCFYDGDLLRLDRMYYNDGYYDDEGHWREKSPEFRSWARSIFRAAKRCLTRHGPVYMGEVAAALHASGRVKLAYM